MEREKECTVAARCWRRSLMAVSEERVQELFEIARKYVTYQDLCAKYRKALEKIRDHVDEWDETGFRNMTGDRMRLIAEKALEEE
jgi:hypothetical protein